MEAFSWHSQQILAVIPRKAPRVLPRLNPGTVGLHFGIAGLPSLFSFSISYFLNLCFTCFFSFLFSFFLFLSFSFFKASDSMSYYSWACRIAAHMRLFLFRCSCFSIVFVFFPQIFQNANFS